ncbi:isocitrate lyase/PEP mutase family protein [Bradyrhizobium sp. U87765 SZCCT0131]|uniref:isocitrate lyase/PEP mutase family protein n=1 Tax=unclassified Bradyrhizobium TaxID=2631580 RepID=UPI001BAB6C8E|nr:MULTISPECIES: isocitrate lyase/PEP mutase family protein [unclassified Bradyrhizobium]MBR1218134.1 isocitrate lyase/PEP mutase family protein [Bradyrhizobium sp. U87765 SZCCT0131]MBR1260920.1 isocitrate lyase/PEP mutase family protein [Bradyrhizobium sp. U87765 SZCCT0134]MBR1303632.1 isocitrate lyase/PEP mutase family protein [Bradyrhizobium sp. U87765 SZCCT0110]MBR1319238.1 isocitrate lyase/PEP mutase family protein [Bradyrhizobium sp. U87765 SZCCT0109]MBR1347563.1 isocitrate lyase/PEP mut
MTQARALKTLLGQGRIIQAPGAPDALTARLVQQAGFPAIYMTGFGATASRLGQPDLGLMSQTEMTTHARDMTRAVSIPVIADADTGYGGPANIVRTVEEYLQAGVAAIHLEDQQLPKRCGQLAGVRVISAEENVRRLRCAIAARGASEMLIIARTDALPGAGAAEAIRRAKLYQDTGVDLVFVDGIKTIADVEAVAKAVDGPKVVSIVDGNETTALTARDLEQMGFQLAFYALSTLFSAVKAIADTLAVLKRDGTPRARAADMVTYQAYSDLVGLPAYEDLDEHYGWSAGT